MTKIKVSLALNVLELVMLPKYKDKPIVTHLRGVMPVLVYFKVHIVFKMNKFIFTVKSRLINSNLNFEPHLKIEEHSHNTLQINYNITCSTTQLVMDG